MCIHRDKERKTITSDNTHAMKFHAFGSSNTIFVWKSRVHLQRNKLSSERCVCWCVWTSLVSIASCLPLELPTTTPSRLITLPLKTRSVIRVIRVSRCKSLSTVPPVTNMSRMNMSWIVIFLYGSKAPIVSILLKLNVLLHRKLLQKVASSHTTRLRVRWKFFQGPEARKVERSKHQTLWARASMARSWRPRNLRKEIQTEETKKQL